MKRQTMIALAVAIVFGLFAVYLLNSYLSRTDQRVEAAEQGMTKVAVAAVPLDYGTPLTSDKVKIVDFPSASIPAGSFRTYAEMVPPGKQRLVLRPIAVNEPILASKLAGEGMGASISYLLPDGMRAAAVRINDVSGVAGFIQPMDSVDVLITRQMPGTDREITDVLLQNVKVIAMGKETKDPDGKPNPAKTATLEVSPVDAQKLALGERAGALSLTLRKPGDLQDVGRVQTVSLNDLRYSYYGSAPVQSAVAPRAAPRRVSVASAPRRPAPRPAPVVRDPRNNVEVVRGTTGSNYEVGGYGS